MKTAIIKKINSLPKEFRNLIDCLKVGILISFIVFSVDAVDFIKFRDAFKTCENHGRNTLYHENIISKVDTGIKNKFNLEDVRTAYRNSLQQNAPLNESSKLALMVLELEADKKGKFFCTANYYPYSSRTYDQLKSGLLEDMLNNALTPIGLLFFLGLLPFAWKFLLNRVADVANAIRGTKK